MPRPLTRALCKSSAHLTCACTGLPHARFISLLAVLSFAASSRLVLGCPHMQLLGGRGCLAHLAHLPRSAPAWQLAPPDSPLPETEGVTSILSATLLHLTVLRLQLLIRGCLLLTLPVEHFLKAAGLADKKPTSTCWISFGLAVDSASPSLALFHSHKASEHGCQGAMSCSCSPRMRSRSAHSSSSSSAETERA